jgi:lipopolysaccharide biosynthesis regulator YciM
MPLADGNALVFIALIFAAAAGFGLARLNRPGRSRQGPGVDNEYFAGLNFLLSEEPDRALDVFLRMAEVDDQTVETHFALGALYRRRGEVDRAIRIHEDILARADLSPRHREAATFALGEDYFGAGLFDRAELLFESLTDSSSRSVPALRYLLRIQEHAREWSAAVATHLRLAALAAPEHPTAIAHYYCELAEQALREQRPLDALRLLRKVREAQRNFPRSALLRARIALDSGDAPLAAGLCRRVVELHPQLLPIVLPQLVHSLRAQGDPAADAGLRELTRIDSDRRAQIAYAGIVTGLYQEPLILECVRDLLSQDANLSDLVPALAGDTVHRADIELEPLARALARIFRRTQQYRCVDCGFATASHFWQCPGCRSWDTLAPVASLELAPMARRR